MKSEFLLGVVGFLVVLTVLVGGMIMAGICHELLTPNFDILYMFWLWIWLAPFWWIGTRTLAFKQFEHPLVAYVGFLPLLMVLSILISWLEPGNPWILGTMVILYAVYFAISKRISQLFTR